jgi:hypothetical protein
VIAFPLVVLGLSAFFFVAVALGLGGGLALGCLALVADLPLIEGSFPASDFGEFSSERGLFSERVKVVVTG